MGPRYRGASVSSAVAAVSPLNDPSRSRRLLKIAGWIAFFIALLVSYPWYILSFATVVYLLTLPWGWKSYRDHERNAAAAQPSATVDAAAPSAPASTFSPAPDDAEDERPARLN